jgi:hypothetical protein
MNPLPRLPLLAGFAVIILVSTGSSLAQSAPAPSTAMRPEPIADTPDRWDAALFLPGSVPEVVLTKVAGASVRIPMQFFDLQLTFVKASTKFDWDKAAIGITLAAGLADGEPLAQLEAGGTISFLKFERGPDGLSPQVRFRVALDALKAGTPLSGKKLDAAQLVTKLREAGILETLSDYLSFSVPVPLDLVGKVSFDDELSFACDDKNGEVKVRVTTPSGAISKKVTDMRAVVVPAGIWLCAQFDGAPPPAIAGEELQPNERWKAFEVQARQVPKDTARMLVSGTFLVDAFDQLKTLLGDAGTVKVIGVAHKGKLVDGDARVWLQNDDENASLTVTPNVVWTPTGLKVTCGYTANTQADIGFNFKLPIGNVGSTVGLHGESGGSVEAQFAATIVSTAAPKAPATFRASGLVLKPQFLKDGKLEQLALKVETDGTFKTKLPFGGYMKTDAPTVIIEATLPVPPDVLPRLPLLTNEPRLFDYAKSLQLPVGYTLRPPEKGFPTHAVLTPTDADATAEGYWVDFKFGLVQLKAEEADTQRKAIEVMLMETERPKLEVGNIKVTVAGIGPNNDLIKALMKIGEAVYGAYKLAAEKGENVTETVAKAAEDFEREFGKGAGNVEKEFSRAERNIEREVGTGAKNTEKAVGKAGRDIENAVAKATNGAGRVVTGVGKTIHKTVEGVGNVITKPFKKKKLF